MTTTTRSRFESIAGDLPPGLPAAHRRKLQTTIVAIESGIPYRVWRGKKLLPCHPELISLPLGQRWRAVFEETDDGVRFRTCLSHERYNRMAF